MEQTWVARNAAKFFSTHAGTLSGAYAYDVSCCISCFSTSRTEIMFSAGIGSLASMARIASLFGLVC